MYTTDYSRTDKKDEKKVMGTPSLIFGLILIGFGLLSGIWMSVETIQGGPLIIVVALFVVGGLLIRSFDKDRKKG